MGAGYRVITDELLGAASGVRGVLDQLEELASDRGWAEQGRGVVLLGASPGPVGHAELAASFVHFCERWEWGMRAAIRSGRAMADRLDATARHYTAGDLLGAAIGNPSDPVAELPVETAADRARALDSIGETWAAALRDVGSAILDPLGANLDDAASLLGIEQP